MIVVGGAFNSDTAADYAVASRIATMFGLSLVPFDRPAPVLLAGSDWSATGSTRTVTRRSGR